MLLSNDFCCALISALTWVRTQYFLFPPPPPPPRRRLLLIFLAFVHGSLWISSAYSKSPSLKSTLCRSFCIWPSAGARCAESTYANHQTNLQNAATLLTMTTKNMTKLPLAIINDVKWIEISFFLLSLSPSFAVFAAQNFRWFTCACVPFLPGFAPFSLSFFSLFVRSFDSVYDCNPRLWFLLQMNRGKICCGHFVHFISLE